MTVFTLTGQGSESLSTGTTTLFLTVDVLPPGWTAGDAYPTNYFRIGAIRFSITGYSWPPVYIDAIDQVVNVPAGADEFSFIINSGGSVSASEGAPAPPVGVVLTTNVGTGSIANGAPITLTWSGVPTPDVTDWLALTFSTDDLSNVNTSAFGSDHWAYTSSCEITAGGVALASGSCTKTLILTNPAGPNYEARLYAHDSGLRLATSLPFTTTS